MSSTRRRQGRWLSAIAVLVTGLVFGLAPPAMAVPTAVNLMSSSCPTLMKQGERDGCVTELQNLLNQHGQSITVDGDFGAATLAAVEVFQSESGLSADGIVGPNTKSDLYGASQSLPAGAISLYSAQCPALMKQGENDGCVKELQNLLDQHGAHIPIDGAFGPATFAAVESFQSGQGLGVDGIVGPNTKDALYNGTGSSDRGLDLRSSSCPTLMRQGEVDGCVITLQALLSRYGQGLAVDGNFGPATFAAVESFQSGQGLGVDGIVGPNTKAALYGHLGTALGAPAPVNLNDASCPTQMQQGERDGCVTELQSLLNAHGAALTLDGIFGPGTEYAVRCFQSTAGLSVDGIVGPNTKYALYHSTVTAGGCIDPGGSSTAARRAAALPPTAGTRHPQVRRAAPASTACASGDNLGPRVVAVAGWLYDAPNSPQQAADQRNYLGPFGYSSLGEMPYVWGGGHNATPPHPEVGYCSSAAGWLNGTCFASHHIGLDCSGFTRWMYWLAGHVDLNDSGDSSTNGQIHSGRLHQIDRAQLKPGDLVFWSETGSLQNTTHVAIYVGKQYVVGDGVVDADIEAHETGTTIGYYALSSHGTPVGYFHVS